MPVAWRAKNCLRVSVLIALRIAEFSERIVCCASDFIVRFSVIVATRLLVRGLYLFSASSKFISWLAIIVHAASSDLSRSSSNACSPVASSWLASSVSCM